MRIVLRAAFAAVFVILVFAGVTWWAAEWNGVLVVTTHAPDGSERRTHVWYAQDGETLWLEAGTPESSWYVDVQHDPHVTLEGDDLSGDFVLSTVPGRKAADHVRSLMRAKYGLRDRWILLWVDGSGTTAILATPAQSPLPGASASGSPRR